MTRFISPVKTWESLKGGLWVNVESSNNNCNDHLFTATNRADMSLKSADNDEVSSIKCKADCGGRC